MDIKLFKPTYHELFTILSDSNKLINKSFKIGAPEGPPVLRSVYELQMDLRITTIPHPSKVKIKEVLNYVLEYFDDSKNSADVTKLKVKINDYLNRI